MEWYDWIILGVGLYIVVVGTFRLSSRLSEPEDIRDHLTTDPAHEELAREIVEGRMEPAEAEELASEAVESTRRERRRRRNDQ